MKKFAVKVTQESSKIVEILAEDKKDAFKIVEDIYEKFSPFFYPENIQSKQVEIEMEQEIDMKYLERLNEIDNELLVCEIKNNQFYLFDEVEYSTSKIGLLKKEEDTIWITNIFYTDDCPNEDENISFYFKAIRGYSVLNYAKYKAKTIKELFMIEKNLYNSYSDFGSSCDDDYFTIETDIPFQELSVALLYKIHNQTSPTLNKDKSDNEE